MKCGIQYELEVFMTLRLGDWELVGGVGDGTGRHWGWFLRLGDLVTDAEVGTLGLLTLPDLRPWTGGSLENTDILDAQKRARHDEQRLFTIQAAYASTRYT